MDFFMRPPVDFEMPLVAAKEPFPDLPSSFGLALFLRAFLDARRPSLTPQALQRVFGPRGPFLHRGVVEAPQLAHMRPATGVKANFGWADDLSADPSPLLIVFRTITGVRPATLRVTCGFSC